MCYVDLASRVEALRILSQRKVDDFNKAKKSSEVSARLHSVNTTLTLYSKLLSADGIVTAIDGWQYVIELDEKTQRVIVSHEYLRDDKLSLLSPCFDSEANARKAIDSLDGLGVELFKSFIKLKGN